MNGERKKLNYPMFFYGFMMAFDIAGVLGRKLASYSINRSRVDSHLKEATSPVPYGGMRMHWENVGSYMRHSMEKIDHEQKAKSI